MKKLYYTLGTSCLLGSFIVPPHMKFDLIIIGNLFFLGWKLNCIEEKLTTEQTKETK